MNNIEIDKSLFTPTEWRNIETIIKNPNKYYIQSKLENRNREKIKSNIFRGVLYLKDNGIKQTFNSLKMEIMNKFD